MMDISGSFPTVYTYFLGRLRHMYSNKFSTVVGTLYLKNHQQIDIKISKRNGPVKGQNLYTVYSLLVDRQMKTDSYLYSQVNKNKNTVKTYYD